MNKIPQEHIAIFYGFACNYSCDGCSSGSDVVDRSEDPDLQEILDSIPRMAELFDIQSRISLVGGEPLLYWNDRVVPIIRACRQHFPNTMLNIFTNAHLLGKKIDQVIELMQEVGNLNLTITRHVAHLPDTPAGKIWWSNMDAFFSHPLIVQLNHSHWHLKDQILCNFYCSMEESISTFNWKSFYKHTADGKIKPWATNDPQQSIMYGCTGALCSCTFGSKLYKCGNLAMLRHNIAARGQLDDPDWKKYLDYPYVELHNSDPGPLSDFMRTYGQATTWCDMCAGDPQSLTPWKERTYQMIFTKDRTTLSQ